MKSEFKLSSLRPFRKELFDLLEDTVNRKQFTFDVKILPEEERTIVADVSTTTCDHDGDIIYSRGADISVYLKNSVVQWAHDYTIPPIAKATEVLVGDDRIQMKMEFATTPRAEEVWQLVKGGFLSACSIGFICKSCLIRGTKEFDAFIKEKSLKVTDNCRRIITAFTLLENSICPVPCNPDALISAISSKSINISDDLQKQIKLQGGNKTEEGDEYLESKPYPNEHAFRINSPDKYKRFRRTNNKFGEGIHAIWGVTEDGTVELQAIRFDANKFTFEEASKWIRDNNYNPISSEPAKEEGKEEGKEEPKAVEEPKKVNKVTIMVIRSGFDPAKIAAKDYKDEQLMAKGKIV